jgi:hypothetical protein
MHLLEVDVAKVEIAMPTREGDFGVINKPGSAWIEIFGRYTSETTVDLNSSC